LCSSACCNQRPIATSPAVQERKEKKGNIEIVTEAVGRNSAFIHRTTRSSPFAGHFAVKEIAMFEITDETSLRLNRPCCSRIAFESDFFHRFCRLN
jgi:hypothetical protein